VKTRLKIRKIWREIQESFSRTHWNLVTDKMKGTMRIHDKYKGLCLTKQVKILTIKQGRQEVE
jgi:hypothetical protein